MKLEVIQKRQIRTNELSFHVLDSVGTLHDGQVPKFKNTGNRVARAGTNYHR
jgi:hypothetical protein